jgi:hypothetical protein
MANPTNDASNDGGESKTTDLDGAFKDLKTQFEADENGSKKPVEEEDDDNDASGDAEADDANDDDDADGAADDSQDDDDSSDDSDDDDDDGKGKQASEFRLSQFKGEKGTPEEYIKNLEDGYLNSSQEALKIKDRAEGLERQVNAIKAAAGKDPEFGEKLLSLLKENGGDGDGSQGDGGFGDDKATQSSNNPFLVHAETEWNQNNEKSIKDFVDANPEVLTDPKINAEVKRWAKVYTREVYESEKRLITTGEAMQMAYKQLGYEDKRNSQQDLVNGMKKNAAPTRPQGAKKKSGGNKPAGNTKQFSDLTLTLAEKMGMSKERLVKGTKR